MINIQFLQAYVRLGWHMRFSKEFAEKGITLKPKSKDMVPKIKFNKEDLLKLQGMQKSYKKLAQVLQL